MMQVYEEIGEGQDELDLNGRTINMRAYCSWFNFTGADQQKKVANLSGGERNRLQLAKVRPQETSAPVCKNESNILIVLILSKFRSSWEEIIGPVISALLSKWHCCAGPEEDRQCFAPGKLLWMILIILSHA